MLTITATQFRANLFEYLDKVSEGEVIVIQRNNVDVARLVPLTKTDWRAKMDTHIIINVSEEELMAPLDDVWADYT